jgi:DNA-binding cell septation regulator SpoVG
VRITLTFSTGRTECHVMRVLDLQRRGLVIACPWRQTPAETFQQVRHLLSEEEAAEVADALGLTTRDGTP